MVSNTFATPSAAKSFTLSRVDYNNSLEALFSNFYGPAYPTSLNITIVGTATTPYTGMLHRSSTTNTFHVYDPTNTKSGSLGGGFTRMGIGSRNFESITQLVSSLSTIEQAELLTTVGDSTANYRVYMKTNNSSGLVDIGVPAASSLVTSMFASRQVPNTALTAASVTQYELADGSVTTSKLASSVNLGAKNKFINGDLSISQYNSDSSHTISTTEAYYINRWYALALTASVTGQRVAGSTGTKYAYRVTGAVGNNGVQFGQRIESVKAIDLVSSTVAVSAKLRSSSITTMNWSAYYANSTDTFSSKTLIDQGSFSINSTATTYSFTFNAGANAGNGIEIVLYCGALGNGQTLHFEELQCVKGSATPTFAPEDISVTYTQCARYYQRSDIQVRQVAPCFTGGTFYSSVNFPYVMRSVPTVNITTVTLVSAGFGSASVTLEGSATIYGFGSTCIAVADDAYGKFWYTWTASAEL